MFAAEALAGDDMALLVLIVTVFLLVIRSSSEKRDR